MPQGGETLALAPVTLLVIGNLRVFPMDTKLPNLRDVRFADFRDISSTLLETIQPAVIISALFGNDHDVIDVARALAAAGYRGRYRALAENVPKPGLIRSEVRIAVPAVDFDVISLRGLRFGAYLVQTARNP